MRHTLEADLNPIVDESQMVTQEKCRQEGGGGRGRGGHGEEALCGHDSTGLASRRLVWVRE